jgi:hypothetical protein
MFNIDSLKRAADAKARLIVAVHNIILDFNFIVFRLWINKTCIQQYHFRSRRNIIFFGLRIAFWRVFLQVGLLRCWYCSSQQSYWLNILKN